MKTIVQFFEDSVNKFADNVFMWEKIDGIYKGTTYKEIREQVYLFGAGLISLGIKKGDRVGLISEGRNAWLVSELGILYAGAANVPLSVRLHDSEEIRFRFDHSGVRIVIVSKSQVSKLKAVKKSIKALEKVIFLDHEDNPEKDEILFESVLESGKNYLEKNRNTFEETWQSVSEDDMANICYTSGTTADPKGIILTHLNYITNVHQAYSLVEIPPYYRTLLILAWDHSFAHTNGLYGFMGKGASIASVEVGSTMIETNRNIPGNIKEIQPNLLMSVPTMAKSFRKGIERSIREKGPVIEKLFNYALKLSYSYNRDGFRKAGGIHKIKLPLLKLFDSILFKKIREGLGGKLDFIIGGGALLDIELQKFFYAIGIPMFQGYGLTEASPTISANSLKRHKMGSSGYLASDLELKICDEDGNELPLTEKGEIVMKGDNVMKGYWKNEKSTNETIKNGWLHTGDMGYMDEDGFLYVIGRFKSLLISDDGEKYSPEGIEESFADQSKYIEQCMLYNNQRPYTVAVLFPNTEALKRYLKEKNIDPETEEGLIAVAELLKSEINEYRTGQKYEDLFPQRWLPSAIGILDEGFTEENRLLNSTLKMVRGKIVEKYQELLDYLYTPDAKIVTNKRNLDAIKSLNLK